MTRKDFELIADTIKYMMVTSPNGSSGLMSPVFREIVATNFAKALKATNPRFDSERFLTACTSQEDNDPSK